MCVTTKCVLQLLRTMENRRNVPDRKRSKTKNSKEGISATSTSTTTATTAGSEAEETTANTDGSIGKKRNSKWRDMRLAARNRNRRTNGSTAEEENQEVLVSEETSLTKTNKTGGRRPRRRHQAVKASTNDYGEEIDDGEISNRDDSCSEDDDDLIPGAFHVNGPNFGEGSGGGVGGIVSSNVSIMVGDGDSAGNVGSRHINDDGDGGAVVFGAYCVSPEEEARKEAWMRQRITELQKELNDDDQVELAVRGNDNNGNVA